MYAYVTGVIQEKEKDAVIIENSGIGYRILMCESELNQLSDSEMTAKIFTYTYVREDAFLLYGFLEKETLALFEQLITVSGIGPKGAMSVLSYMDRETIQMAILSQDAKLLSKAPGIGAKTAARIILELKDKVSPENVFSKTQEKDTDQRSMLRSEAIEAMVSLGYTQTDAFRIISKMTIEKDATIESVIKAALKSLA